ncbi:MAG: YciI family protein [Bacteroidota bacterium]|nr:YciI family protein [Bacteroidota bacterium]
MENFILIVRGVDPTTVLASKEEVAGYMNQWTGWRTRLDEKGHLVLSIQLDSAKVIYGKAREALNEPLKNNGRSIGGYLIVKAESMDEAIRISNECPALDLDGSVEVRSFKNVFHGAAFTPAN